MGPDAPLPLPAEFSDVNQYVESLLEFATTSWMLQTLCGGVHILDFYTRSPDLYATILPQSWRTWFRGRDIMDILDLLMREDLSQFDAAEQQTWRGSPAPPEELLQYIRDVRRHLLARSFPPPGAPAAPEKASIARHIALGMKVKKVHEVDNFARYIDRLTADIKASGREEITHLVDFGSGQNYLGRALAAPPYSKHLVAVESRQHNIEGAKKMDIKAKLVEKPVVYVNKKKYRAEFEQDKKRKKDRLKGLSAQSTGSAPATEKMPEPDRPSGEAEEKQSVPESAAGAQTPATNGIKCDDEGCTVIAETPASNGTNGTPSQTMTTNLQVYVEGQGSVQYVEHIIKDGDLNPVMDQVLDSTRVQTEDQVTSTVVEEATSLSSVPKPSNVNAMVMSLHSCGNLVHHGLRSLLLSKSVSAVAMVGCCYNLVTERLGPPTYKLPTLRPNHPRLEKTANAFDPHGFPMSEKLASYPLPHTPLHSTSQCSEGDEKPTGIRLNITSRMMAVQAPFNWGRADSELFFSRHFYRALLQRIFLDRGVVSAPVDADSTVGGSASGHTSKVAWTPPNGRGPGLSSDGTSTPLTIGTLRKFAYNDFKSYVRAAITKLTTPNTFCEVDPDFIKEKMDGLTDEDIGGYEERYREKKHELSVMWSLMAFSAGVVEAVIVTDRWLWLKEQKEIETAWVEPVFDYALSPRNLVVVGIKKRS